MERAIENVNWLLHESTLTQTEIAKEVGVSNVTIHNLQKHKRKIETLTLTNFMKLNQLAKDEQKLGDN